MEHRRNVPMLQSILKSSIIDENILPRLPARGAERRSRCRRGAVPNAETPFAFDGPPVPVAPEVVTRDADGRATVRAVRLSSPLRIDGALDEALYNGPSVSGFVQVEPALGVAATENTEVWVAFDDDNVYFAFRCWDSAARAPRRHRHAPRRQQFHQRQRHRPGVSRHVLRPAQWPLVHDEFDWRAQRRAGTSSRSTTPTGIRSGNTRSASSRAGGPWRWRCRSDRSATGRARRRSGASTSLRSARWKNELSVLTPVPAGRGNSSAQYAALAATLVGIEAPPAVAESRRQAVRHLHADDRRASAAVSNDFGARRRARREVRPSRRT